jgi:hypothetical protein
MAWPGTQRELIRFGPFELVTRYHELRKRGIAIKLRLQPFAVLSMLVQQEGRTIFRGEIHNTSGEASPSSAVSISRSTRFAQPLGTMRRNHASSKPSLVAVIASSPRWSTAGLGEPVDSASLTPIAARKRHCRNLLTSPRLPEEAPRREPHRHRHRCGPETRPPPRVHPEMWARSVRSFKSTWRLSNERAAERITR